MFYVYMIDLKDSRKMDEAERRNCQARLKDAKNAVNAYAAGRTRAEFSSGDSLQGYADDPALALRVCLLVLYLMLPTRVHCGIGVGEIYVLDREEGTNASDGPAYHDALSCLDYAKGRDLDVAANVGGSASLVVHRLLSAAQALRRRNTAKQNMHVALLCLSRLSQCDEGVVRCALSGYGLPGGATADAREQLYAAWISGVTGTSIQNVYAALGKSGAPEVCDAYEAILLYLAESESVAEDGMAAEGEGTAENKATAQSEGIAEDKGVAQSEGGD